MIPNFLDCASYRRRVDPKLRNELCPEATCDALVVHVSNFRPVKRVEWSSRCSADRGARPRGFCSSATDRGPPGRRRARRRLRGCGRVASGNRIEIVRSSYRSRICFCSLVSGELRSRRARSDGVRSAGRGIARRGLPEVIEQGVTGFLCAPEAADEVSAMADRAVALLTDRALHARIAHAAAEAVRTRFCTDRLVPL